MDNKVRANIQLVFDKVKEAFEKVNISEAKDYFLTLGNVNEIYLMKKNATMSVYVGKIFDTTSATCESEARKVWTFLTNYFTHFTHTTSANVETPVQEAPVKKTRKPKKVVEQIPEPQVEVDAKYSEDEDSSWMDAII